jgi:hypothetical protein
MNQSILSDAAVLLDPHNSGILHSLLDNYYCCSSASLSWGGGGGERPPQIRRPNPGGAGKSSTRCCLPRHPHVAAAKAGRNNLSKEKAFSLPTIGEPYIQTILKCVHYTKSDRFLMFFSCHLQEITSEKNKQRCRHYTLERWVRRATPLAWPGSKHTDISVKLDWHDS